MRHDTQLNGSCDVPPHRCLPAPGWNRYVIICFDVFLGVFICFIRSFLISFLFLFGYPSFLRVFYVLFMFIVFLVFVFFVRLGPSHHVSFPDAWAQIGIRGDSTRAARAAPSSSSVTTGWTGRGTQTSDPCWGQKPDKSNNPVEGGCLFHQQASDGGQRL